MNDGGPAFPRPGFTAEQTESQEGMSLRDWFAGMALTGAIRAIREQLTPNHSQLESEVAAIIARSSYAVADAMLKEREKTKQADENLTP